VNKTKIEWADATWNPVTGCTPISEGCTNCYAERMSHRLAGRFGYHTFDPFRVTVHHERFEEPLRWKKPRRIFVCSMGDFFHANISTAVIDALLEIMAACPQHTFMVLTKRPENIEPKLYTVTLGNPCRELGGGDYLPNLWLGVTVENQKRADERLPYLLRCPAKVRFVSIEPMLGPVDLEKLHGVDHVICGGETGPGARLMQVEWARELRDQCNDFGVPFFFKKMGGGRPTPKDLEIRQWPKEMTQ